MREENDDVVVYLSAQALIWESSLLGGTAAGGDFRQAHIIFLLMLSCFGQLLCIVYTVMRENRYPDIIRMLTLNSGGLPPWTGRSRW